MKPFAFFIALFLSQSIYAQRITGMVMGDVTHLPLAYAGVSSGSNSTQCNAYGIFTIDVRPADSVRINCAGYQYYAFKPNLTNRADTMVIYVKPIAHALKQVNVRSTRNFKGDSINTRNEFDYVLLYKGTRLGDVFLNRHANKYVPNNYITSASSTSAIIGVNVLSVVSLLSKNKDPMTKLQKTIIRDEGDNYVDHEFSKEKVATLTSLKGDRLETFMETYRPSIDQAKKMSEYEMIGYIKKSYEEFKLAK
jgi:hypothetical protein